MKEVENSPIISQDINTQKEKKGTVDSVTQEVYTNIDLQRSKLARKRVRNLQTNNNSYTIELANNVYGEDFVANHYFEMYPTESVHSMGDKTKALFIGVAVDKSKNVPTKYFKYNLYDEVLLDIDIDLLNPYYKYIQDIDSHHHVSLSTGYHLKEHDVDKMPSKLQQFLSEYENMYSTRINSRFTNQNDKHLLLNYEYTLHPPSEITEWEPIPGISTIEVFDENWESIGILRDLPFAVDDFNVSQDREYVVVTHRTPIDDGYEPHVFKHFVSIYNLKSGELCWRKTKDESHFRSGFSEREESKSVTISYETYFGKDSMMFNDFNLLEDGQLTYMEYSRLNNILKAKSITEKGLKLESGIVLSNEINFSTTQLNCK